MNEQETTKRFTLKREHVAILRRGNVTWNDSEAGAPGLDIKRPYGNSDFFHDIAEILGEQPIGFAEEGWEDYLDGNQGRLAALHKETETALQVILSAGSFEPGEYEADLYRNNWRRA